MAKPVPKHVAESPLLTARPSEELDRHILELASGSTLGERGLYTRVLLHLPRIADGDGAITLQDVAAETGRLAARAEAELEGFREMAMPPARPVDLASVSVQPLEEDRARIIHQRFHYLQSFRRYSDHYASVDATSGQTTALATFSPLDIPTIVDAFRDISAHEVRVLSRVFAFDWAPRNSITHLLRRATALLTAKTPGVRLLLTYLNPNLGFSGASYRAGGWEVFGYERGTRYVYLDGDYVTDRFMFDSFGPDWAEREELRGRMTFSRMQLEPLVIYSRCLDPKLGVALKPRLQSVYDHPEPARIPAT